MKETFSILKTLWNNKRYRAIFWLVLYAIFFIIVFSIIKSANNEPQIPKPVDSLEEFKKSSYQYTINNEIIVDKDKNITCLEETCNAEDYPQYNFDITTNEIYSLIKKGNLKSQDYIENSTTYLVTSEQYNEILKEEVESTGNVYITVFKDKEKDEILEIIIDFSEFYDYDYIMDLKVLKEK